MGSAPVNILLVTSIAIAIGEGQDSQTLDLLGSYFFLVGSTLKTLASTKDYEVAHNSPPIPY